MGETVVYQKNDILFLRTDGGVNYIGVVPSDDGTMLTVRWWITDHPNKVPHLSEESPYGWRHLLTKIGSLEMLDLSL
jgi:hypothetical protein